MKTIDLFDLEVEIDYQYSGPQVGAIFSDTKECEMISAHVLITSVKCNGIEIIEIIPDQQLLEMEEKILLELANQN